jgi:predicted extracellular nuclease
VGGGLVFPIIEVGTVKRSGHRTKLVWVIIFPLLILPLAVQPAWAAPTELFFSEYVEGSSNNKALEIFNGTGSYINLAAGNYTIEIYFNGNSTPATTINLTGTVASGDVYVVADNDANAAILSQADQTSAASFFNGDDAVVLKIGTTTIDVIGQIGFDPGSQWGSGNLSTEDNTIRRKNTVEAGDPDGSDDFEPELTAEWDGFAEDTFDGLGSHDGPTAVTLSTFTAHPTSPQPTFFRWPWLALAGTVVAVGGVAAARRWLGR